MLTHAYDEYK